MTEWKLGFQLVSGFLHFFQGLWELLVLRSKSEMYCMLFHNNAERLLFPLSNASKEMSFGKSQ